VDRDELAWLLHDTVQQRLFGLSTSLQALQMHPRLDTEVRARIEVLVDELEVTIAGIRATFPAQWCGWALLDPELTDPSD
jgi:signal transduction histidine kinase